VLKAWQWLSHHDIPNWGTLLISGGVAAITWLFRRRPRRRIPGLEVFIEPAKGSIFGKESHSVRFRFTNKTGHDVYVRRARISKPRLQLQRGTWSDVGGTGSELKFRTEDKQLFEARQIILRTDAQCETMIYTARKIPAEIGTYDASVWRRLFRSPKYFVLEYVAVVADRPLRVRTVI
jgi:hypothetical protein